jgi:hypothetical protein
MKLSNDRNKMLRLISFLISALLMMTVSAAVYNYMYMQATSIGSATAKVTFANGADATAAGTTIGTNGTYVKFTSLSGWPNATRVYENATVIRNQDGAANFACRLSRDSWSGSTSAIDELYVRIYNAAGTLMGAVDVKTDGNYTTFTIPHGEVWRVEWRIKWTATALSTDAITATLALRVTGEGTSE